MLALSPEQVNDALLTLPDWTYYHGRLKKTFVLQDFKHAMMFVQSVAIAAEELDHHPEWSNIYNKVTIALCTHDAGNTATALDIELAHKIEAVFLSAS